jgi:monoamine oxidase
MSISGVGEDVALRGFVPFPTRNAPTGTIPLSVLSQIQIDVGARVKAAIDAVPYASAVKVGLQFKRRFWEEDEEIIEGSNSYEFTSMPPAERVARAVALGSRIHPQYGDEFENGIAVAWHRVPFTLGCAGYWTEKARAEHYDSLYQIDGRIVLAGEHASYLPAWQEGAVLSSLDAIARLHARVVKM